MRRNRARANVTKTGNMLQGVATSSSGASCCGSTCAVRLTVRHLYVIGLAFSRMALRENHMNNKVAVSTPHIHSACWLLSDTSKTHLPHLIDKRSGKMFKGVATIPSGQSCWGTRCTVTLHCFPLGLGHVAFGTACSRPAETARRCKASCAKQWCTRAWASQSTW